MIDYIFHNLEVTLNSVDRQNDLNSKIVNKPSLLRLQPIEIQAFTIRFFTRTERNYASNEGNITSCTEGESPETKS